MSARRGTATAAKTDAKITALETKEEAKIADACGTPDPLASMIAIDTPAYVARAAAQSRCMTAIAHPDPSPLALDCGPRDSLEAHAARPVRPRRPRQ